MTKKFHLYHTENGNLRLVEIVGGVPCETNPVRGEVSEASNLRGLFDSIKNLSVKLQWDGFVIVTRPTAGAPVGCVALSPAENRSLRALTTNLNDIGNRIPSLV